MDVSILRVVVAVLGLLAVACVSGIVVLAGLGHEPPQALAQIAGNAASFLGGILVTTGHEKSNDQQKSAGSS